MSDRMRRTEELMAIDEKVVMETCGERTKYFSARTLKSMKGKCSFSISIWHTRLGTSITRSNFNRNIPGVSKGR